jgi:hypothetical protein
MLSPRCDPQKIEASMRFIVFAAVLALAACSTTKRATIMLVETEPTGALVRVEGFGECESPCRIELDAPRNLTIAKAGYDAERIVIEPGRKKVTVTLKLSAPTTTVDEEALPEL